MQLVSLPCVTLPTPPPNQLAHQIGGGGISPTVLAGMMDVLIKRQFVRIRCGTGGGERKALAKELERLLDCQCVHQIGHTITLYRQKGLARPRDCSCSPRG